MTSQLCILSGKKPIRKREITWKKGLCHGQPARIVRIVFSSIFVSLTEAFSCKAVRNYKQTPETLVTRSYLHASINVRLRKRIQGLTPPVERCLNTTSGLRLLRRMPTASSSISSNLRCSFDLVASSMIMIRSAVFATRQDGYDKRYYQIQS